MLEKMIAFRIFTRPLPWK